MDIFIDESGTHKDTGHATNAVVYIQVQHIESLEKQMQQIIQELDIEAFHWARHGWKVKEKFFKSIMNLEFTCMIAIFKNPYNPENMIEIVFRHLITNEPIHTIYIDGRKPKWYERRLRKVLRDRGISIKKLKTVRNEISHPGIQLADAIAGLVRYYYDNPSEEDGKRLFKRLQKENKLLGQFLFEPEAIKKPHRW